MGFRVSKSHISSEWKKKEERYSPKQPGKGRDACVKERERQNEKTQPPPVSPKGRNNQARQTHRLRPVYVYPIPKNQKPSLSVLAQSYTMLS